MHLCGDRMKMSLPKKKKKKKKNFFFFFRETPTSPWVPFRAKFRPLGRLFRPSRPLAWSLIGDSKERINCWGQILSVERIKSLILKFTRITACFSSFSLVCVNISVFWLRQWSHCLVNCKIHIADDLVILLLMI